MRRPRYMALSGSPVVTPVLRLAPSGFRGRIGAQGTTPPPPPPPSGGTFGNNHGGLTPSGSPDVGLVHASGNVHPRPPNQTPTPTPGTSTQGSIIGGSDSGLTVATVPVASASSSMTVSTPSSVMPMLPDDTSDEFGLGPTSGVLAQLEALSTPKKVALAAAVAGSLYLLFGRKR